MRETTSAGRKVSNNRDCQTTLSPRTWEGKAPMCCVFPVFYLCTTGYAAVGTGDLCAKLQPHRRKAPGRDEGRPEDALRRRTDVSGYCELSGTSDRSGASLPTPHARSPFRRARG